MENRTSTSSRPLAVESFSDSWLSNKKPTSIQNLRFFYEESQNFDFHTQFIPESSNFVHADELFSNGIIKPIYEASSTTKDHSVLPSDSASPSVPPSDSASPSVSSTRVADSNHVHLCCSCYYFPRGIIRLSERILKRVFRYFRSSKKSTKVDDIDRREKEVKSSTNTINDIESSINEAVLHCKRSIEK
ncbi:hypothetical protein UlMin_021612 [Ulmus minor]